jgi:cyclophilin family peptidyl-prolyl cis-trans isomerase
VPIAILRLEGDVATVAATNLALANWHYFTEQKPTTVENLNYVKKGFMTTTFHRVMWLYSQGGGFTPDMEQRTR